MSAVVTGVSGQDGSYLAELLLSKGYEVHGFVRPSSTGNLSHLSGALNLPGEADLTLHYVDLADPLRLANLIYEIAPDEVYHLAAQTDVGRSFTNPEVTAQTNAIGTLRMLEAVRSAAPGARFYNAASAEMFGRSTPPQSELTQVNPCSPYGYSKAFSYWATVNYREAYRMHASNGICFNHESERRGRNFVTQKIACAVAEIERGERSSLELGNLAAIRDWGYAPEYVAAMWQILQQDQPDDYVVATGRGHTIADFCDLAFSHAGLDWNDFVRSSDSYVRPEDPPKLVGDSSKARDRLGWTPKTEVTAVASLMVEAARRRGRPAEYGRQTGVPRR